MSLLDNLSWEEYDEALHFTKEQCVVLASYAGISIDLTIDKPGDLLLKELDMKGYSVKLYRKLKQALNRQLVSTHHEPHSKVAILIANELYDNLSNLNAPSVDCDSLGKQLMKLEFIVIKIKNTKSSELKNVLGEIFKLLLPNSYCFIYYAGHGCQIDKTRCMLGTDCPLAEKEIHSEHYVTEKFVLNEAEKCQLDLCIFIMDMCSKELDTAAATKLLTSGAEVQSDTILLEATIHLDLAYKHYKGHKNLVLIYSAQASAYEVVKKVNKYSTNVSQVVANRLEALSSGKVVSYGSLYVIPLCAHLEQNSDIVTMIDAVHNDFKKMAVDANITSVIDQKPIKIQYVSEIRSLYDHCKIGADEITTLASKWKNELASRFSCCTVERHQALNYVPYEVIEDEFNRKLATLST